MHRKTNMTLFFNYKRLISMQLIKNNIGRIQSDRNLFETRSGPKQRRHIKIDVEDKKKQKYKK
jgi:hypothetical protein